MSDDLRPSNTEQEYFHRQEVEKLRRMAAQRRKRAAAAERDRLRRLHFMRCPKCGSELHRMRTHGIDLARCFDCQGSWLDDRQFQRLVGRDGRRVVDAVLDIFRK